MSSEHGAVHQEEKCQPGAKLVRETVEMSDSYRSSHSGARALQVCVTYGLLSCVQVGKPISTCSRRPGPESGREQNEAAGSVGSQGATGRHVLLSQQYCPTCTCHRDPAHGLSGRDVGLQGSRFVSSSVSSQTSRTL